MKKYLYFILLFLVCVPAIAGTINSYTEKNPGESADAVVIYDSDDGSTKKVLLGNLPSSGSGINWSSYTDLTSLSSANEFIVNDSGTSKSINWEVIQTQLPSNGWTDNGSIIYNSTTSDNVGIGTSLPDSKLTLKGGSLNIIGSDIANSLSINSYWKFFHSTAGGALNYLFFQPVNSNTEARFAIIPNGTVSGTSNTLVSGIKIFQTGDATDFTNSCDFGMYMTSSGMRFNTKQNGTCPAFPTHFGHQDTVIDMTISTTGNVGIGTTVPANILDVYTGSGQIMRVSSTANSSTGGPNIRLVTDSGAAVSSGSRVASIFAVGAQDAAHTEGVGGALEYISGSAYSGSNLDTDLRVRLVPSGSTTLGEVIRLKSSGNVGIGTVNPLSKLGVNGSVAIGSSYAGGVIPPSNGLLVQGNVGIGTVSPKALIDTGLSSTPLTMPGIKATTGTRYLCIGTDGQISSSASACSGT